MQSKKRTFSQYHEETTDDGAAMEEGAPQTAASIPQKRTHTGTLCLAIVLDDINPI